MSAADFCKWLVGLLDGSPRVTAEPDLIDWEDTSELVNGELRPAVIVGFPSGDMFVISVTAVKR